MVCVDIQAQNWTIFPNCTNLSNSTGSFTYNSGNLPLDLSSVTLNNATLTPPQFPIDGVIVFPFTFDASVSNLLSISFNDATGTLFTSSFNFTTFNPVNFNNLTFTVTPDCGTGTGIVDFDLPSGSDVSLFWLPLGGTYDPNLLTISDLPAQTMFVIVNDNLCNTSVIFDMFNPIVIPNGQISYSIDQVTPVSVCASQTVAAAGSIPGSISGTISGGSGNYSVNWLSGSLGGTTTNSINVPIVTNNDTFSFEIIDNQTSCELANLSVEVQLQNLDLDLTIQELSPMITNGDIDASGSGGPAANSIVVSGSLGSTLTISPNGSYNFDYSWSPAGGDNSNDGNYTNITVVDDYSVAAQLNGSSCTVLSDPYNFPAEICLGNPDLNWDGFVNGGDLLAFIGVYGSTCQCQADMNGDGEVNGSDWLIFLNFWFVNSPGCSNSIQN